MTNKNIPEGFHNAVKDALKEVETIPISPQKDKRLIKSLFVALVIIALMSVTVFACSEIYNIWFKNTGKYSWELNNDEVEFQVAPEYVTLEFDYLPMEFTVLEAPYKYNYNGGFGLSFNLWKMSSVDKSEYKNIINTEAISFSGNTAEILTINNSDAKLALIYFENMGVVVECFYNKKIPQTEIKAILDGLHLVETTADNAIIYDGINPGTSQPWVEDNPSSTKIIEKGDVYSYCNDTVTGAQFTVKVIKSELMDNVNSIDKSYINSNIDISTYVDENGNLKAYERENIVYGDGINSIDIVESVEMVGRKIVAVTLEIENVSSVDGSINTALGLCNNKCNYYTSEPFAVSGQNGKSNRFYFVNVSATEKKTVTIYSLVDDDIDFNDLYILMGNDNCLLSIH